ncbi:MAG: GTPase [Candidatus Hodarchaeales archaeon]|jgi:small GTP-binding protein
MNWNTKFKWYKFSVVRKIRNLEGDELVKVLEEAIQDIKEKKLDKNGLFKLYIQQLQRYITDTKTKPKKGSNRQYDPFLIPRSGDGRVVLFGLSNVGKSTLMNAITNTDVKTGSYLHTTREALAGTLDYQGVKIQIIDLPGFLDFKEDWSISKQIVRVARTSDSILLVIDLSMDIERQYNFLITQLINSKLLETEEDSEIYNLGIIATKGDLPASKKNYEFLKSKTQIPIVPITINNLESLNKLKKHIYDLLEVIRIYTKPPRKEPVKTPFIIANGSTVNDLARKIHNDLVLHFRYAKIWGKSVEFPGQRVGPDHTLTDEDIVEITAVR